MIDLEGPLARGAAFGIGVLLHLCVFRIGEWDIAATRLFAPFALLQVVSIVALMRFFPSEYDSIVPAIKSVFGLDISLIVGLTLSILVYRGFFHRLCTFPGPFLARFSNLYVTTLSAKNLHLYEEVQQLHKQYGDFVRIGGCFPRGTKYIDGVLTRRFQGPSEISVCDPNAVAAIHSASSGCTKGPWYNILYPMISLQGVRTKQEHIRRRKVWDRSFSAKGL